MTILLAQSTQRADRLFADILPWLGLLVVIILLGGGLALYLRRRFATVREAGTAGFTLEDLRRMRDTGEMSEEEFTTAKSRMLEAMNPTKSPTNRPDSGSPAVGSGTPGRITPIPPVRPRNEAASEDADG